jgi:hypothetical protein
VTIKQLTQKHNRLFFLTLFCLLANQVSFVIFLFFSDKIEATTMEGHKIKTKSKFKVRHQKHKLFRANEPLLSVVMWGVNFTVS